MVRNRRPKSVKRRKESQEEEKSKGKGRVCRTAHEAEKLIDKDPEMGVSTGVRRVTLFALLVFANLTPVAFAQSSSCPGIHVKVLNIRNSTGTVDCELFDSPVGFLIEALHSAMNVMVIKIRKTEARCNFEDIPPGT